MASPIHETSPSHVVVSKDDFREFKSDIRREIVLWVGVSTAVTNLIAAVVAWTRFNVTPKETAEVVGAFIIRFLGG